MVVAVQQPSVECTAIFTVCIVQHRPPPCAMTTHKVTIKQACYHSTSMESIGRIIVQSVCTVTVNPSLVTKCQFGVY